ncbi:MAG: 6,7-dimethyl-8-ribityllumazine synthase [Ktedonobacteraceae bacterium]|nr:6,7-dimethyl-8-ribityllumazine synthase [Ktedonobacteraceae bacterium]
MSYPLPDMPQPDLDGRQLTIGIVVARYNWHVTGAMLALAKATLHEHGVAESAIDTVYTPGSFELATAAQALLSRKSYHALICFGCVMKGETRHDVLVGDAAAQGIQRVALDSGIPVIFGVISAENRQQAEARIVRGRECAEAAIEMARLTLPGAV